MADNLLRPRQRLKGAVMLHETSKGILGHVVWKFGNLEIIKGTCGQLGVSGEKRHRGPEPCKVGPSRAEPRPARKGEAAVVSQSIYSLSTAMPSREADCAGTAIYAGGEYEGDWAKLSEACGSDRKKSSVSDVRSCP